MTLKALLQIRLVPPQVVHPFKAAILLAAALLLCAHNLAANEVDPLLKARLQAAIADSDSFADRFDAEVWLTDMALRLERRVEDPAERITILENVHREAARADLPPELVLAVIDTESNFDRFAVSSAGARGLMQVMPFWLAELNAPDANLFDIQTNLRMGCTILRYYMDMENDQYSPALARYNGSTGKTWYPERVMGHLSKRWFRQ